MKKQILEHFKKNDPAVHTLLVIAEKQKYYLKLGDVSTDKYFYQLCREIAGQQLTGKAAAKIFARFIDLFPNKKLTPRKLLNLKHEQIRAAGLSNSKANYLQNIARAVVKKTLTLNKLPELKNEEVIEMLTQIKGIGNWTAEMFLIFTLGRENVFSHGDLGLRKGIKKVYNFKKDPSHRQIEKIVKKWEPYKSYASLMMWASLDKQFDQINLNKLTK
jgi:DNA-3-methyladenine glycosylase II